MRRPKVSTAEARFLQPDQIAKLLQEAETSRYAPLFAFLVNTGLRRGEALALRWNDIDLEKQVLRVRGTLARVDGDLMVTDPKSDKSRRTIPLSAPAVTILAQVKERTTRDRREARQTWQDTGFVFVTDIGEPCDPRNALRALKSAADKAGLEDIGRHTLRHSVASVMLSNAVPITSCPKSSDMPGSRSPSTSTDTSHPTSPRGTGHSRRSPGHLNNCTLTAVTRIG